MVRLLRPQPHSQRLSSFLRMNDIGTPAGNLEGHLPSQKNHRWCWCAWVALPQSPKGRHCCSLNTWRGSWRGALQRRVRQFVIGETDEHFWPSKPSHKGFYHRLLGPPPQILLHIPPTWPSAAVYVVQTSSLFANRMSALSQLVLEQKTCYGHRGRPGHYDRPSCRNRLGHRDRPGRSNRHGYRDRHGSFLIFSDSNRVSNTRKTFQGSKEL